MDSKRLSYLPGLDGLRAIAIIAVLLYHGDLRWFPGGFLGVDVFFVISGYLITSLLLAEWRQLRQIDLKRFWQHRARRLFPALFLVVLGTLAFAVVLLPNEVAGLRGIAVAAVLYTTNWYLVFEHRSYFETIGRPSLLLHLWSLAVEEQFYLLWPPLFIVAMRFVRRQLVLLFVLSAALASTLLMAHLYQPDVDPSRIYYGTDTRASELLIGVALAFVWAPAQITGRVAHLSGWLVDAIGIGALGILMYFFFRVDEFQPFLYQGGFAVVSLATAVLIACAVHPLAHLGPSVLGRQPLRWVGLRSYGIYVWHWPVFVLTRPQLDVPFDGLPLLALRLALVGVIVELSYRYVETPIRSGALGRAWAAWRETRGIRRRWVVARWVGTLAAVAMLSVGLGIPVASAKPPAPPSYLTVESVHTNSSATPSSDNRGTICSGPCVGPRPDQEPTPAPPSPTAEPTPQPTTDAFVATATPTTSVNLRAGPGPAYNILRVLTADEGLAILGRSQSGGWLNVRTADGLQGWAFAALLTTDTSQDSMPVVLPPPTPTQPDPGSETAQASAPPDPVPATPDPSPSPTPVSAAIKVTAIGDSVMLGAVGQLQQVIGDLDIDSAVGRQVATAIDILQARRAAGQLGDVVVVHVGNNGTFSEKQFDEMMAVLSDVRRVVFVNVKVPGRWEEHNNTVIANGVARYPNAVLADWQATSANRPDLFWDDGIHLRPEGARIYAQMIASYVTSP